MSWSQQEIEAFTAEAWEGLEAAQSALTRRFDLEGRDWQMDQQQGTVTLTGEGRAPLTFDAIAIGSLAKTTWMWAWANDSILENFSSQSAELKQLTETSGLAFFAQPLWEDAIEDDAWSAAAIALKVLGGTAVYRCPIAADTSLFVLLRERFNA